jgi:hypothetical protein
LFGTNKILERASILVVFQRGTTKNFNYRLIIYLEGFGENELIYWPITEFLHIPPKNAAIS